jgi:hypothetical protein
MQRSGNRQAPFLLIGQKTKSEQWLSVAGEGFGAVVFLPHLLKIRRSSGELERNSID